MSLYCVGKVLNFLAQAVVQVEFPAYAPSIYMSYKIAKLDKQPFRSKVIFCLTPLHAHAQYICIVYAKYQKASVKALVYKLTSRCMHYLSKSKTSKQEKRAKFTKLSFCQKLFFLHKTSSCKCSMCLYYVGKVSDGFSKSSGTS